MRASAPARRPAARRLAGVALAALCALAAGRAAADAKPMDDEALSQVRGAGVAIAVHLVLDGALLDGTPTDTRITLGFNNGGQTTYAVLQNLAGIADFYSFNINMRQRSAGDPGSDYFDISLPETVSFTQFGVRAIAVTKAPDAPITKDNSYGSLILDGQMTMTGHLYLWPNSK